MIQRVLLCAVTVFLMFPLAGCNRGESRPEVVPVSGKVTMNGEPLSGYPGFLRVVPENGRPATGRINAVDGSFTLTTFENNDGCIPGTHPVAVLITSLEGGESVSLIPEKYMDASTSELTVTIDGPTNNLVIELEGELKPRPNPKEQIDPTDDPGPGVQ